jgi:hypothetical protein
MSSIKAQRLSEFGEAELLTMLSDPGLTQKDQVGCVLALWHSVTSASTPTLARTV